LPVLGSSERVAGPSDFASRGATDCSLRVPGPVAGGGSEMRRVHSLTSSRAAKVRVSVLGADG
jgi:hypothetical protein